jgi:hypothetical protein
MKRINKIIIMDEAHLFFEIASKKNQEDSLLKMRESIEKIDTTKENEDEKN